MTQQTALALALAIITSGLVWAVSPIVTGHPEPWDADGIFYVAALLGAGVISGAVVPRPLWAHYAGAVVGQLGYQMLFLPLGPLVVLGAVFLLAYGGLFLAGAVLGSRARLRFGRDRGVA